MAFDLGSIRAVLDIDDAGYTRGILNAQALNSAFGASFSEFVTNPVVFGIGKIIELAGTARRMGSDLLATAEEVERLGRSTGVSTDIIQALRAEFDLTGKGADAASDLIKEFNLRLGEARRGSGEAGEAINALGTDILAIEGTDAAFRVVFDRLSSITDEADRAALANKLFGEVGARAAEVFSDSLGGIEDRQRSFGNVLDSELLDKLAAANTIIGELQQVGGGLVNLGLAEFIGGFVDQTNIIDANAGEIGNKLSAEIVPLARELGEIVGGIVGNVENASNSPLLRLIGDNIGGINAILSGFEGVNVANLDREFFNALPGANINTIPSLPALSQDELVGPGLNDTLRRRLGR